MSKLVKVIVGTALVVAGFVIPGAQFLISIGLSLVVSALLSPSLGGAEERQASEQTLTLGESFREVLFGRYATAGSLLDAFNFGGEYGTDWEVLIIALADHECDALEGFYVSDDYENFSGDGAVSGYNGQLEVYWLPGTATQTMPSIVTSNSDWSGSSDRVKGVSCVVVAYKADEPDTEDPVWPGGRPRFLWQLRGKKLYNPAKDSTVAGGSGAHRWADPSTYEWSDNANVCRYNFVRGIYALDQVNAPEQLLLGRGLSETEAPADSAIAHIATCDEDMPLAAGGTEKRYRFNGIIAADEDFLTAEGYFAAAMAGVIRQPEGTIEVEPGQPKAVVAEITDADILNLEELVIEQFRGEADSEWLNTVVPRYVEPEQKWKMHSAPVRREQSDILADGGPRSTNLNLKHVTSGKQAQRCGEIARRLGRLVKTSGISLGPRFAALEEGDWIGWTSARHFDGQRVVFRIESFSRSREWRMKLNLREISALVYGFDATADEFAALADNSQQGAPAALAAPAAGVWSLTGTVVAGVNGSQPALLLTGAVDNSYATSIRVEYRLAGATEWQEDGRYPRGTTRRVIPGVADGTDYDVAVSYLVDGEPTPRRILGPVEAGLLKTSSAAAQIVSRTVAYPLSSNDTSISIAAFSGVLNDGRTISFPAATLSGLASNTAYAVFRDHNAGTYSAIVSPANAQMADSDLIFVGSQRTSSGGTYDPPPSPPDGWNGDGTHPY